MESRLLGNSPLSCTALAAGEKEKDAGGEQAKTVKVRKNRAAKPPLTAEAKKNRILFTIMGFCLCMMAGFFLGWFTHKMPQIKDGLIPGIIAAVIGASAGFFAGGLFGEREEE